MDKINGKIINDKRNLHRLVLIDWQDAYDNSDEIDVKDINIEEIIYQTPGFLLGIHNRHLVLGYNKEKPFKGVYKSYGAIPESLITNAAIMDRNCD